ncbi:pol polyprotein [Tanacetum coccineum]
MERKIDEWSKSQNVSLEQTDRTEPPPPPQAHWMTNETNVTALVNVTGAPVTNIFLKETASHVEPPKEGQPSNAQAVQAESLERKYKTKDAVAAIIEKLPPSRVDFKNYLKHKRKEMSVEDLIVHLRIEEDNKLAQKNTYAPDSAKANMVEHVGSSLKSNSKAKGKGKKKNDKKGKGKAEYLTPKAIIVKQKFQRTCYNYNQPGHHAANCKMPKRVNPCQANMVNDNMDMISMVSDIIAMIYEVNLVGSNNSGWCVDIGATRHVCADKSMFHSFRAVDNGEKLYMGNSATADIKVKGDVILKMTFEKELKLTNVLYVLEIRKNLMSGWLFYKFGFRLVFESDKFVLSKNQMYVGRGYAVTGIFKLNVMVVNNGHLGHYCYLYLLKSKDEAIEKFVLYETKVENQLGRKIKVVRSDKGGEYVSPFSKLCMKHGIRHEFTAPYSPQQNGIAKMKNRTLKEMVNAMLINDEVVQEKRKRDDNDLHDERQDQLEEEEVEPRRSKRARTEKSFGPNFVSFMVENEPTSYRDAVTSTKGQKNFKVNHKESIITLNKTPQISSVNAITPDLPTVEPDNSLSMEVERLSTIPEIETYEVIKSSVENLVPIPSEFEGIFDDTCDVPVCDDFSTFDALKDHSEILSDSNDNGTLSDDDDFEDIEYINASPPDSELVSLEEVNDVDQEKE